MLPRAGSTSDYVSIPRSSSCVMPFRSQAKCLLAIISHLYMTIWAITYHDVTLLFTACCCLCATMVARCFESRARAAGLHVLPSMKSFAIRERCHAQWKKWKSWTVTKATRWRANMTSKKAKISWIFSSPRCRCRVQTYTPKPGCHTSDTGGLVWAVRL